MMTKLSKYRADYILGGLLFAMCLFLFVEKLREPGANQYDAFLRLLVGLLLLRITRDDVKLKEARAKLEEYEKLSRKSVG